MGCGVLNVLEFMIVDVYFSFEIFIKLTGNLKFVFGTLSADISDLTALLHDEYHHFAHSPFNFF